MACADEPSLLAGLVQRLNQVRPLVIMAHTSKLALLAAEQHAGRLAIAPVSVTAMGEQLTETNRAAIGDAFGLPLINQFASTEGLVGHSDPGGEVLSFASDMCIAELVDQDNQPAPDGTPSAKVLLTNLYNHTWPLIRYELTDRFTRHPTGPGSGQLRATVEGRADDTFRSGAAAGDGGDRHRNRGAGRRDERERIWAAQKAACPGFADDERTTTRQVPVIVLEPARLSDGAPARCGAGRRPAAPGPGHFRHVRGGCRRWARHMASRQRRRSPERIYAPGSGCSRRARRSRHRPGPLVQAVTSRQHG